MPTPTKGKSTYLAIGTLSSETDISTYVKTSGFPLSTAKEDTTTHGNTGYESSTPTIISGSVTFELLWNSTISAIIAPLLGVEGKSIIWGPAGNSSPKWTCLGYLSKMDPKSDAKGIVTMACEFIPVSTVTIA